MKDSYLFNLHRQVAEIRRTLQSVGAPSDYLVPGKLVNVRAVTDSRTLLQWGISFWAMKTELKPPLLG